MKIGRLGDHGALTLVGSVGTQDGARNGVVSVDGKVYLAHSKASELVVVSGTAR